MPVGRSNHQADIMREAVENQTPDCIIVDEISSKDEVGAAKTIAQRGVSLIATVHGTTLPEVLHCKDRGDLVGGCSTVTLSGAQAERRKDKRKQVLKRGKEPIFNAAIELHSRNRWIYHPSIKEAVDAYLDYETCDAQQFEPGRAIACKSIPADGCFEYSVNSNPFAGNNNQNQNAKKQQTNNQNHKGKNPQTNNQNQKGKKQQNNNQNQNGKNQPTTKKKNKNKK